MNFWTRLDEVREHWNVLHHPFYMRWSQGKLTQPQIAYYSGQYRHAVVALAGATEAAAYCAGPGLGRLLTAHAHEERQHVNLWDGFVAAVGGDTQAPPNAQTEQCVAAWAGRHDCSVEERLGILYAIEAAQPAISQTKFDGLVRHYGIDAPKATAYFELHAQLDVEHAAQDRNALNARLATADEDAVIDAAERALAGNWLLLDGVEIASWDSR